MISSRKNLGKYSLLAALVILFALGQTSYWGLNQLKKNVESEFYRAAIIENLSRLDSSLKDAEEEFQEYSLTKSNYSFHAYNLAENRVFKI